MGRGWDSIGEGKTRCWEKLEWGEEGQIWSRVGLARHHWQVAIQSCVAYQTKTVSKQNFTGKGLSSPPVRWMLSLPYPEDASAIPPCSGGHKGLQSKKFTAEPSSGCKRMVLNEVSA